MNFIDKFRNYWTKEHVKPFELIEPFGMYKYKNGYSIIPMEYGIDKFGVPAKILIEYTNDMKVNNINELKLNDGIELRDYQKDIIKKILCRFNSFRGTLLQMQTGGGKTFTALYVSQLLKSRTLICVPSKKLANQWYNEIKYMYPNSIISDINDVNNRESTFTIVIVNSFIKYINTQISHYGYIIYDECHRYASVEFSKVFKYIQMPFVLGMSATVNRLDGFEKIIKWNISMDRITLDDVYTGIPIEYVQYQHNPTIKINNYPQSYIQPNGRFGYIQYMKDIYFDKSRNNCIIDIIMKYLHRHQIMVIVQFKETVDQLVELFPYQCGVIYGNAKYDPEEIKKNKIIFATRSSGSYGIDIPDLDTIILTTSFKPDENINLSLKQVIGRILRKKHKTAPLIIDLVDNHGIFLNHGILRTKFYKKNNYVLHN